MGLTNTNRIAAGLVAFAITLVVVVALFVLGNT